MCKKSVLIILLFTLFIILWIGAADAAFQVRVIHFVPNGEVVEQDFNAEVNRLVKHAQTFYANEMERREYGRKTFRLEIDATDAVVVHRIHGRHNRAHYQDWSNIEPELPRQFVNEIISTSFCCKDIICYKMLFVVWDGTGSTVLISLVATPLYR